MFIAGLRNMPRQNSLAANNLNADVVRDDFSNYFVSPEGELPWQYEKVLQNNF